MSQPASPARVALRYVLYFLSCALILYCLLALRTAFLALVSLAFTGHTGFTSRSRARVLDIVTVLFLGIGATVGIVALDSWYRDGQRKGVLGRRFARFMGVLVLALGLAHGASWLAAGGGATLGLAVMVAELAAGGALALLPAVRPKA